MKGSTCIALNGDGPRRVLFIGAGASFGARDELSEFGSSPPLGEELLGYIRACLPAFTTWKAEEGGPDEEEDKRLRRFFARQRCRRNRHYECAIDEWLKCKPRHDRLLYALNRLLAFSIHPPQDQRCPGQEPFQYGKDRYDDLVQHLGIDPSWRIISLNYDALFEEALGRTGRSYWYPGLTDGDHGGIARPDNSVPIYKPHGSCNWFPGGNALDISHMENPDAPVPDEDLDGNMLHACDSGHPHIQGTSTGKTQDVSRGDFRTYLSSGGGEDPIMAHYCASKVAPLNGDTLTRIREDCVAGLGHIEHAVVIGVRLVPQDDDPVVDGIFNQFSRCPTEYVCGNPDEARPVEGQYGFRPHTHGLQESLAAARP